MNDELLRDRVARRMFVDRHSDWNSDPGDYWDKPRRNDDFRIGMYGYTDAALAEVAAYRRERVAEFEVAVRDLLAVAWNGGRTDDAEAALRKLWLEG